MVQENKSKFYKANESDVLIRAITQILSLDIRSVKQGRGEGPNGAKGHASQLIGDRIKNMSMMMKNQENNLVQSYEVEYDVFHINFTIRANTTDEDDSERRPWILIDSIALTSESGSS